MASIFKAAAATLLTAAFAAPALAAQGSYNWPSATADGVMKPAWGTLTESNAIHAGGGNAVDTALALDVAAALAADPRLEGATITVAANNGAVMLSGSAESPEQSEQAQIVAQKVAGVGSVSGTLAATGG